MTCHDGVGGLAVQAFAADRGLRITDRGSSGRLDCRPEHGRSSRAPHRLGANTVATQHGVRLIKQIGNQLRDPMIVLLLAAVHLQPRTPRRACSVGQRR